MSEKKGAKPTAQTEGGKNDKEQPAHELLSKLFQTILDEAERNPRFAKEMLKSLPEGAAAQLNNAEKTTRPQKTPPAKKHSFLAKEHNPITLYREFGEDLMRVKLQKLTIANLNSIIRQFQLKKKLKLTGKTQTKQSLITALLTFAAEYDRQRKGAAG